MSVAPDPPVDPALAGLLGLLEGPDDAEVLTDPVRVAAVLAAGLHAPARDDDPEVAALLQQLAADLDAPVALLNGVLPDALVLAAAHGVQGWLAQARATPLEWSPCREVVRSGRPWVVTDLAADPMTRQSPLVTVDGLRAYAGVPLCAGDGSTVGALCVVDVRTRPDFGAAQVERLRAAAAAALVLLGQRPPAD